MFVAIQAFWLAGLGRTQQQIPFSGLPIND
jgi:hypothetical protein